jgi:hypothetical protein
MGGDADRAKHVTTDDFTIAPVKAPATSNRDDDRLGALAKSHSETNTRADEPRIKKATQKVEHSFHWFSDAARDKLEKLRANLKKEDAPRWSEQLATGLLEGAITAGAGAAGKFLASKAVGAGSETVKGVVGGLFTSGIQAGVNAGKAKFAEASNADAIDRFIEGQKEGVWTRQLESQNAFIDHGQDSVQTVDEAESLARACSENNVKLAAEKQYEASRDAWVGYLAQAKFGAVSPKYGPVGAGETMAPWGDLGITTTNMSNEEQRTWDRKNRSPLSAPKDAPALADAVTGDAPGVLEVIADLPSIEKVNELDYDNFPGTKTRFEMHGSPEVRVAFLNGVNETIRKQYQDARLGELKIPRQIVAKVSGAPDFTLNLDEQGKLAFKPRSIKWLAARAKVEKPERAKYGDEENHVSGIELLLNDLITKEITKKIL